MKRLVLLFAAATLPAIAFAQIYTVKIYDAYYGRLVEKDTSHPLEEIELPYAVSKDKFAEFLKDSPDFVAFDVPQAKLVKFVKSYRTSPESRSEEKREFLLCPIDGNKDLVSIQLKLTEKFTSEDGTVEDNSETVEAAKIISLGVPTIVHRIERVAKVIDYTPILGRIPLIGRFWQTPGESRMAKHMLVLVTENKDEK